MHTFLHSSAVTLYHLQTALDIHSHSSFCYGPLVTDRSPQRFKQTPSCGSWWGRAAGVSPGTTGYLSQEWGQSWARGGQRAAGAHPPTAASSDKRQKCHQGVGAVAFSDQLHSLSRNLLNLPTFMILVSCPCVSCLGMTHCTSQNIYLLIPPFWRNTEQQSHSHWEGGPVPPCFS